jgi:hypothetical protein
MEIGNISIVPRRSSRIPAALPIRVTSLAGTYFSEVCKTLVVNAHGCSILSPVKFDAGVPLRFHTRDGRETTAYVVSCQPAGPDNRAWKLGARLDRPENFWGLSEHPEDWALAPASTVPKLPPAPAPAEPKLARANQSPEALLDLVARRLETPLRRMIAESMSPLQAEVAAVKQTLARREANPSRFEVSLSQIPPQLEAQLEARLKKDIEPKALEESRQQYADLMQTAKATLEQRTAEGYEDFRRRAADELKNVEKRAQETSAQISANAHEQVRRGLEDFQQKLLEGGNSLKRLGDELLEYLQQSLDDQHNERRHDLEQLRASVAAESSRLRQDVQSLDMRMAKLDESARSLEAGLDKRLGQMAGNTVKETRDQLESITNAALEELNARILKLIEDQLTEASGKMAKAQASTMDSVSESLQQHATGALQTFDHSIDEMAKLSVERWRLRLATTLTALAKNLGEQFEREA